MAAPISTGAVADSSSEARRAKEEALARSARELARATLWKRAFAFLLLLVAIQAAALAIVASKPTALVWIDQADHVRPVEVEP